MATLTGQTIASSYEQLLSLPDGGGDETTLVAITDGDGVNTFAIKVSTRHIEVIPDANSTTTFDVSQADGTSILSVDTTNSKVIATELDISGNVDIDGTLNVDALDIDGALQLDNTLTVGVNDTGYDVKFFGDTATNGYMLWDASTDDLILGSSSKLGIGTDSPNEGKLVVQDSTKAELVIKTSATATDTEAALMFKISTDTIDQRKKGGIIYKDVGDNGIGDMFFVLDSAIDNGSATVADNAVMTLKNNGNVGIGQSSPVTGLDILSPQSSNDGNLKITSANNGSSGISFYNTNSGSDDSRKWMIHTNFNDEGTFEIVRNTAKTNTTNATALTITKDSNVGLGITSPDTNMHIHKATAGSITADGNVQLVIENNTHVGMQFLSPAGTQAQILFGDVDDGDIGYINYNHDTNALSFATNTAVGMTISSAGNVSIGATKGLYFDGGTHTYIAETGADILKVHAGGNICGTFRDSGFTIEATSKLWLDSAGNTYIHEVSADAVQIVAGGTSVFEVDANSRISLSNNDSGTSNTVFGKLAGNALNPDGNNNCLIGEHAGNDLTTADHNVAIGFQAFAKATTSADNNTIVGNYAMGSVVSNDVNNCVVIGYNAIGLGVMESGASKTVAIGVDSLKSLTSGDGNVAIGYQTLDGIQGAHYNTAVGYQALTAQNTNGNIANTGIGYKAGTALTSGFNNTMVGTYSGYSSLLPDNTVCVGYNAAGSGEMTATADGTIAIGSSALSVLTSGAENIAIGYQCMIAVNDGAENIAIGYEAMLAETSGAQSIAIGSEALKVANTTGTGTVGNIMIGHNSGIAITTGARNTVIGAWSMQSNQTGAYNTGLGYNALQIATGSSNTMVGYQAGDGITSGANNTGIGQAVAFAVDANNQTCVGFGATTSAINSVKIGNGSVANANIQVDWTIDSDIRIKKDIEDNTLGLSFINSLKPKKYRKLHPADWDKEIREKRYEKYERDEFDDVKVWDGLIAQDVKESIDKSRTTFSGWSKDANGKQGIQYSALVVPLIKAVQELSAKVTELENKLK